MQKRNRYFPQFILFVSLSILSYLFFHTSPGRSALSVMETGLSPFSHIAFVVEAVVPKGTPSRIELLEKEVNDLKVQLAAKKDQEKEIEALRDQFRETSVSPRSLLPAKIIGLRGFVPGYPVPDEITIDKGAKDGVKLGQVVVVKNNIIGRIGVVSQRLSIVELLTKENVSLTTVNSETGALGLVKGQGEGQLLLDNVLLSESLKVGDLVLSKGSVDASGIGAPPSLVVGKVKSVEKKPSALFQTAKIDTLIKITSLNVVFVLE